MHPDKTGPKPKPDKPDQRPNLSTARPRPDQKAKRTKTQKEPNQTQPKPDQNLTGNQGAPCQCTRTNIQCSVLCIKLLISLSDFSCWLHIIYLLYCRGPLKTITCHVLKCFKHIIRVLKSYQLKHNLQPAR